MEKVYKTAIYLKISRDEEGGRELEFCGEYSYEGLSGYDFGRPQFQQMISDVKKEKINCIVVKDFSRLGRNFLRIKVYHFDLKVPLSNQPQSRQKFNHLCFSKNLIKRTFKKFGVHFIFMSNCCDKIKQLQQVSEQFKKFFHFTEFVNMKIWGELCNIVT